MKYRNRASSMRTTFTLVLARSKEQKLTCRTLVRLIWVAIVSEKPSTTIRRYFTKNGVTRWSRGYLSGQISCEHNKVDIYGYCAWYCIRNIFIFIFIVVKRKIERNTEFQEFYWIIICMIFVRFRIWKISWIMKIFKIKDKISFSLIILILDITNLFLYSIICVMN